MANENNNQKLHDAAIKALDAFTSVKDAACASAKDYNVRRKDATDKAAKACAAIWDAFERGETVGGATGKEEWCKIIGKRIRWIQTIVERHRNPDKPNTHSVRVVKLKEGDTVQLDVWTGKNGKEVRVPMRFKIDSLPDSEGDFIHHTRGTLKGRNFAKITLEVIERPKEFSITEWLKRKHPDVLARYNEAGLHFDQGDVVWIPPVSKPDIKGWSKMSAGEKQKVGQAAGCEYCLAKSSARSCPLHGWPEKRHDHDVFRKCPDCKQVVDRALHSMGDCRNNIRLAHPNESLHALGENRRTKCGVLMRNKGGKVDLVPIAYGEEKPNCEKCIEANAKQHRAAEKLEKTLAAATVDGAVVPEVCEE